MSLNENSEILIVSAEGESASAMPRNPRQWGVRIRIVTSTVFIMVSALSVLGALWVRRTFGNISFEQMLMNVPGVGRAGVTEAESAYISSFIEAVILPTVLVLVLVALAVWGMKRNWKRVARPTRVRMWTSSWAILGTSAIAVIAATGMLAQTVGVQAYLQSMNSPLTMSEYYVEPDTVDSFRATQAAVKSRPADDPQKLNLITIYLESVEDSFVDEDLHGANLLAPVTDFTEDWQRIPELYTYEGGGWTMGGLVGTQCGIPLRGATKMPDGETANAIGLSSSTYMPNAQCLGDVLSSAGYQSVFMGGADETFASKESFLLSHGYDEVLGLSHWIEQDAQPRSQWGLSDRTLLQHAVDQLSELREGEAPYHLTLLTLDFHEPFHAFEYCERDAAVADEPMAAVLECSMEEVATFLQTIEQMGVLEDTVVVLMGDHPKMLAEGGAFWDELSHLGHEDRPLFNRIWAPNGAVIQQQQADQLSMYATTLDLLGLVTEDTRAGLGVSVLDTDVHPQSALTLDAEVYSELLRSRSPDLYQQLWGVTAAP